MKVIRESVTKTGKRSITVEVNDGETLLAVRAGRHYQLADPVNEVVAAHIFEGLREVTWCSATQEWV